MTIMLAAQHLNITRPGIGVVGEHNTVANK